MIWFIFAIIFAILAFYFHSSADKMNNSPKVYSQPTVSTPKVKTYWDSFEDSNPAYAKEIETLWELDFSTLSDRDAREKKETLERLSMGMSCSISQIRENYLMEIEKYPARLIPYIIESTSREMAKEAETFHINDNNTASALMVKWLKERLEIFGSPDAKNSTSGKMLYHEGFIRKSQEELKKMSNINIFRYRCKEAIIQKMIPFRYTDNVGCHSEACKTLMLLAKQIENNTELMANALIYGYAGEFSKIIYDEIGEALQSYCGMTIDEVLDY